MKTFREMKIGDICYEVELKGIKEHLITMIDCSGKNTRVRINRKYFENRDLIVEENPSIAISKEEYSKPPFYADIQLAKEKLYEIRHTHITNLHKSMIDAINRYEEACKILRCYSDCNVPEDVRL